MSDSSQVGLRYIKEVLWGVTPAAPAMQNLRFTGESLSKAIESVVSGEIRSDRQVPDVTIVGASSEGSINGELSYGTYDDFIAAALFNPWGTPVAMAEVTLSAANADQSFNDSGSGFVSEGIVAGQWLKVAGFTSAVNNGWFQVVSVIAGKIVVTGGSTLEDEVAGDAVTMAGTMIRNGVTEQSFAIEEEFTDIVQFLLFNGLLPDTWNLNLESRQIVTTEFGFMGSAVTLAQASVADSEIASTTSDVINAATNIANILEGGAALSSTYAKTLTMALANNVRGLDAIGSQDNVGTGAGRCVVTGTLSLYFEDETYYDKLLNETASSISVRLDDGTNQYILTLPKIKYTEGAPNADGPDDDVMLPLNYQAMRDPVTDCTIQIDRA